MTKFSNCFGVCFLPVSRFSGHAGNTKPPAPPPETPSVIVEIKTNER
jgi:hypothetical protein